jgi:hypothetical protein
MAFASRVLPQGFRCKKNEIFYFLTIGREGILKVEEVLRKKAPK